MRLNIIKLFLAAICLFLMSSCSNTSKEMELPKMNNDKLEKLEQLDISTVSILVGNNTVESTGNQYKLIVTIDNQEDIEELVSSLETNQWKKVDVSDELKGEPYFFVQFNEVYVLAVYPDVAYGFIADCTNKDNELTISNKTEYYYLSNNFFDKLWEIVKPFSEQLDVEIYGE